jgi:glutamate carboxypeptidase
MAQGPHLGNDAPDRLHLLQMQQLSPAESAMIAGIDQAAMLAQVEAWSAINTGTANLAGLAEQAALLAGEFAALPGEVTLKTPGEVTAVAVDARETGVAHGGHLVLRVRPEASRRLLLTGHMDTVYAADDPFRTLRWLDDATLNGPGVADMKGGLAVILAALKAFERSEAARAIGYDVLINSDEEVGSPSSAPLIAGLAQGKYAALTYEPSALPDGTLTGARSGSGNYSLVVRGRSAHAGRNPEEGRNALVAAADLAVRLKEIEREGLTVNPARIDGGSANNVVPDLAILRFNIRPRSKADADWFDLKIGELMPLTMRRHNVLVTLHGGLSRPPKPLDARSEPLFHLVRDCGAALGQTIGWKASGGVCDGNNIAACGVPVVDTMGVRGGAIHSDEEYLIVPSLSERAALSALVLHRLATGGLS